ncbi:MAG: superoxide dismutase [Bacteroidota bacterium]
MKFLALEKEIPDIGENRFTPEILRMESMQAWKLTQQGVFREIYLRSDRHEAVIMMECDSLESAHAALNSLPLMQAGLITFDIAPLVPYNGFARLFASPT